jgi:NAD(P) transhydrogenase subunit alpha
MNSELPKIIQKAEEISAKVAHLTDKLKTLAYTNEQATSSGIDPIIYAITIFALACFVGYYVVWKVTPSLHTPLMSLTNAISGIIVIGAIFAAGIEDFGLASAIGYIALFLASINIFGGFIVTERMLEMFKK